MDLPELTGYVVEALAAHGHFADIRADPDNGVVSTLIAGNTESARIQVAIFAKASHDATLTPAPLAPNKTPQAGGPGGR